MGLKVFDLLAVDGNFAIVDGEGFKQGPTPVIDMLVRHNEF